MPNSFWSKHFLCKKKQEKNYTTSTLVELKTAGVNENIKINCKKNYVHGKKNLDVAAKS